MSRALINHSPDLAKLRKDGYEIDVIGSLLLLKHVPYVTADRRIEYGTLVSTLTLSGDRTATPDTHVVSFIGQQPCHKDGREIQQIKHQESKQQLCEGVVVDRSFSNKPPSGYPNYFEKMTTYEKIISGPAEALDPSVTAKTYVDETTEEQSVFEYADTATARAAIGPISQLLAGHKIAIVGLGGTGSYILDLIAKTPVSEIHLYDGDRFLQHNAFRSPGAASLADLRNAPFKAEYFRNIYSRMHKGIAAHTMYLDSDNADELSKVDFVFLCLDSGEARKALLGVMQAQKKPFVDVGMGINIVEGQQTLIGTLRVSTSTLAYRSGESRIPLVGNDEDRVYDNNIQVADLNCLNAALAVIKWKKLCGFYQDLEHEHFTAYAINGNQLVSEERA